MKKNILLLLILISFKIEAQKTPDFYFQKNKLEIKMEFSDTSKFCQLPFKYESKVDNDLNFFDKERTWAMEFQFNHSNIVNEIRFVTYDHEIADFYLIQNDSLYGNHELVDGIVEWKKEDILILFTIKENNNFPYQFIYSKYVKKD